MTAVKPGAEAFVDGLCGCQFLLNPIRVRVIKQLDYVTLGPDLVWVQVYQLTYSGDAVRMRELLVIRAAFEAACVRGIHRAVRSVPRPRREVSSRALTV